MNRAFISLYLLIVVSVIIVGWTADRLWQVYEPEPDAGPFEQAFFDLILVDIAALDETQLRAHIAKFNHHAQLQLRVYHLDDFAESELSQKIRSGARTRVREGLEQLSIYQRIEDSAIVVRADIHFQDETQGIVYVVFLSMFYLSIALIIYFWIWPLTRDLRRLELQTRNVGKDDFPQKIDLGLRSTVYPLASAFNQMAERIEQLIASHKEMTYAVSHELRTPLARIKFALEIAKDREGRDADSKELLSIRKDVGEMEQLISDLLSYAGYEQQSQSLTMEEGDLAALTDSLLKTNGNFFPEIHSRVDNRMGGEHIYCDWILMERCLHNIIQNAFKHAESEILITLFMEENCYCVAIEDDGPGISKENAERIFNSFVRIRGSSKEKTSGFGLGLAIVTRIIKWHQGRVKVEASVLGGAKFCLCWPNIHSTREN